MIRHPGRWLAHVSGAWLVLAAALWTAAPAGARADSAAAPCTLEAAGAGRDCTIRGTVTGTYTYKSTTDDVTTTWSGRLVFRQVPLPERGFRRELRYVLGPGSVITWSTGGSAGGCPESGGGTLDASKLVGELVLGTRLRLGVWRWSANVNLRAARGGETLMPSACAAAGGFQFLDTSLGQPSRESETDGARFTGSRSLPGEPISLSTRFALTGQTYATQISKHGLDFIKTWEGLPRCKGDRKSVCPYNDSVGNCTIGYGRLIRKSACTAADLRLRWTLDEAEDDLRELASKAEYQGVIRAFSKTHGLNQCQFDALMSFVWNAGRGNFRRLTRSLPLENWEPTVLQRLLSEHITATVRNGTAAPTKDKQGNLVVRDPNTGKLVAVPIVSSGKNGTTITFKDPSTGKLVTITPPVANPRAAPRSVTLEGLVKRRWAEMKLFTAACPCAGAPAKTPSTVYGP